MAQYPVSLTYREHGILHHNNLQCTGLEELKATLQYAMQQGDSIEGVYKINKYGEHIPYDYKKLLKLDK